MHNARSAETAKSMQGKLVTILNLTPQFALATAFPKTQLGFAPPCLQTTITAHFAEMDRSTLLQARFVTILCPIPQSALTAILTFLPQFGFALSFQLQMKTAPFVGMGRSMETKFVTMGLIQRSVLTVLCREIGSVRRIALRFHSANCVEMERLSWTSTVIMEKDRAIALTVRIRTLFARRSPLATQIVNRVGL